MISFDTNTKKFWCVFDTKASLGVVTTLISSCEQGSRELGLVERSLNERLASRKSFDGGVILPILDAESGSPVVAGTCCAKCVSESEGHVVAFGYIGSRQPTDLLESFQVSALGYADSAAPLIGAFVQEKAAGGDSHESAGKLTSYMNDWESSLTYLSRVLKAIVAASTATNGEEQARHLGFCIQAILAGAPELVARPEAVSQDDFNKFVTAFSLLHTEVEGKKERDESIRYFGQDEVDPECLLWAQRLVCSTGCENSLAIKSCAEKAKLSVSKTIRRFHSYLSETSSDYHAVYKAIQFVESSELANTLKFIIRNNLLSDTKSSGHENLDLIVELLDRDGSEIVFVHQKANN